MATAIITSVVRTIDDYAISINGDYLSNRSNTLRRVSAAIREAFGHGSHVLLDDDGNPVDGRTFGVRYESPYITDGRYTLTYTIRGERICDIKSLCGIPRAVYDERIVRQLVDRALGQVGIALGEMVGFKFPNVFNADVHVTVLTTNEQQATVVIDIRDKR